MKSANVSLIATLLLGSGAGSVLGQSAPPSAAANPPVEQTAAGTPKSSPSSTLKDAAQSAVLNNPEVQARWHAFKAAGNAQDVARGGYFPRVDLAAAAGRERLKYANSQETSMNTHGATLTLTQMLFDGFATREEVKRLGEAELARYYELLDASESTAQEAARAYFDVQRYRHLVALAQENYAQHKQLFDQIQAKANAGVGRRVDMEQAGGRLALAESNLITETSNLHDVTARYQRIVGEIPPPQLAAADLTKTPVPANRNEAASAALKQSPAIKATVANVRAAQAEARGQKSTFMPRIDLRASENWQHNYLGNSGGYRDQVIEVALNYNLFKGGSDRARSRELAELLNQTKDLRDKACRDVRQTLAIAYNDTQRLAEQLRFLDQHQLAQEKVRDAYRKQFDIGQRTLLDLLDTENELFQARRAYANAENDLNVAYGRTHAAIGDLLPTLGLKRLEAEAEEDPNADPAAADVSAVCPPDTPTPVAVDREAILSEAAKATGMSRTAAPRREQPSPGTKKAP